ncbi:MAG: efflux RND transporter periplasmic adaptor subunit [Bacteroidota bacterium]|nr:efflux RND transporter periplasmic adaptor subunit [Bacteroidota bacterium]
MANNKKSKKKLFIFSGIGVVVLILVLVVLLGSKRENIISVQTEKVSRRTITQVVTASGQIEPETTVKINAEVSGEIVALPVKEGEKIHKGELLVRIKPDQYQAQVDQAQAALSSAKAALALQSANLEKARTEFNRGKDLYAKKLISDQDYIASKTSLDVAKAQYQSAQAGVDQAEASLKQSKEALYKTAIYSPIDGVVSQLISELGERVSGSSFTQGTQIMTVADLSRMEAQVNVGENDVVLLAIGDTSLIDVDAYPSRKLKGIVYEIATTGTTTGAGTQDEVTNFLVKVRILDKDIDLHPGMSMTADIQTETKNNVLAVPIQSVTARTPKMPENGKQQAAKNAAKSENGNMTPEKQEEVVFVAENGKVKQVPVKRGISNDSYTEIVSGVKEGMEVVSGSYKAINRDLEDGAAVRIENNAKKFGMAAKETSN